MLKKIRNYSALVLLSLVVLANSALAVSVSASPRGSELIEIDGKAYSFYSRLLTSRTPQSYSLTIKEGQKTEVKIQSREGVSIKLYLPGGEVKEYGEDKSFTLEFHAAGEYMVEIRTTSFSSYRLETSIKEPEMKG